MSVSATPASATAAVGGLPRVSMGIMVLLSIAIAFANAGLQSVLPAIGRRIGIPDMLIASVFVISSTFYVLTSAYWAHLSDMIGRKPLMVVGSLGLTLAMGLSGVAVSLGLAHVIGPILCFALFALGRSLNGILGAATGPAMQAYIADHTEGRGRVRAISTNAGANGFGTIFGPMLAPLFVTPFFGLAGPLYAFCLFGLFVMIATRIWLPEKRFPVEVREVLRDPFGAPRRHAEQQGEKRPSIWLDKRVQPFLFFALLSTMC
ncbi:MAG: MFS transporter, partial [Hyphomonadaceae bacterium]